MKALIKSVAISSIISIGCAIGISTAAENPTSKQDEGVEVSMVSDIVVAKVLWTKGKFTAVSPDGKLRSLEKESVIYLHDTLQTDGSAQAQIVFTDDSLMTFRPSSKFYIEHYEYKPQESSKGKYFMNLIEGGFRTVTGLVAKGDPDSYQVQTPVATIGVRGTDYTVVLDFAGQLFVGYHSGRPCVSNKEGSFCLDDKNKYVEVPNANTAPVPVSQQPGALQENVTIVPANYTEGGIGGGNVTMPGDTSISSFCIN